MKGKWPLAVCTIPLCLLTAVASAEQPNPTEEQSNVAALLDTDTTNTMHDDSTTRTIYLGLALWAAVTATAHAGPMVMYGRHEVEDEEVASPTDDDEVEISTTEDSSFAFGYYGRAGIDFQYSKGQHVGLGVRYMAAEMDFDKTVGKIDLEGPQFVLTYSQQL